MGTSETIHIIDAWIQHPTKRLLGHPSMASILRWTGQSFDIESLPDSLPMALTLGAMDAGRVRRALVSAWWGPQGPIIDNDEVAAQVQASGGRLIGVASVDVARPMDAVRELRRAVKTLGFRALRVLPWLWNLPPDDRRYYPLYAECCELGIPFCLQVGHTGPLCPSEPGRPIPYLDHVALEFPELVIVGGHVGFPWTLEMVSLARKYPNVYIDTSAYKANRLPSELVEYMRRGGRKKVLFGSNFPMITPKDCLAALDELGLDDEARALYLAGNARRVFQLDDAA